MASYAHDIVGAVGQGRIRRAQRAIAAAFSETENFHGERGYGDVLWTVLHDVMEEAVRRGATAEDVHDTFKELTNDRDFIWEKLEGEVEKTRRHRREPIEDPNREVISFDEEGNAQFRRKTLKEVDREIAAMNEETAKDVLREEVRLRRDAQKELLSIRGVRA